MRPRILHLHYKTAEKLRRLRKEAEQDDAYRVAKQIHAVLLNNDSKTSSQIAGILDAPLSRVSQWLHDYEKHGYEALLEGHRSGRIPKLSEQQKTTLGDIIDSGPVAYGFLTLCPFRILHIAHSVPASGVCWTSTSSPWSGRLPCSISSIPVCAGAFAILILARQNENH